MSVKQKDIKAMNFDELVSEWNAASEKITKIRNRDLYMKLSPFQVATNEQITERLQKKLWAIEREIDERYKRCRKNRNKELS